VLSDGTILRLVEEGRITIKPWNPEHVQPASVDLRLGDSFRVFHNHRTTAIDLREPPANLTEEVVIAPGDQFVIHPGEFVLGRTLEWVELPEDIVARIEGKALALDTPIPTPTGWKLMDQIQIGDLVFDEHGQPTAVIDATGVMTGRECREVVFADGTSLVCDLDHQWVVQTKYDRKCADTRVLTTREMEDRLHIAEHEYAFHIPQAAPIRYSPKHQTIDPYVLGVWIGDGTSTKADVTSVDAPILRELEHAGYAVRPATAPLAYRVGGTGQTRDQRAGVFRRGRAITEIRRTDSVPVRCIQVASPRGLYLATRSFIPTHNSSLGRLGLIVHATAGFCDPGWKGTLTLELNNLTRVPIILHPGLLIAQLSFMTLDAPALRPYGSEALGSHYQGQVAATESRYEGRPSVR
jgi:deoxycytidine triphosphate deaminase